MISPFQKARIAYVPRYPAALSDISALGMKLAETKIWSADEKGRVELKKLFPHTIGQGLIHLVDKGDKADATGGKPMRAAVVLSGGQAPGGHNVIWGIVEGLKSLHEDSQVIGFRGGPSGILNDYATELTPEALGHYHNTGGFDILGSGRTKIETPEQFAKCREVLEKHKIDALVIIGGDDSNTNAALLAEYFVQVKSPVKVLGVPKTIDGDLKNPYVETSFGFDTAVRLYAELISNISRDALSARKYYHFIRLMGRSASHITLESALQTQPNLALISEEIALAKMTLRDVVEKIGACVKERAKVGKNYGVILVPEGLVEFVPEVKALIKELNQILAEHKEYFAELSGFTEQSEYVHRKLSKDSAYVFGTMPIDIQRQLLMDRDPHGNVQVSRIETEKLLIEMLESYLGEEKAEGRYVGKFAHQRHFLGYEGRCAAPTNFDADYAYSLGRTVVALVAARVSGYMAVVTNLAGAKSEWQALGVPLVSMMHIETRKGKATPVIAKSLVDLGGRAFHHFELVRESWANEDMYRFAGPIQYFGPAELTDKVPVSLALERGVERDAAW